MNLINIGTYENGLVIDIFKFHRKTVIELTYEESPYASNPNVLLQLGPDDVAFLSLGVHRYSLSMTLWGRHYDD